MGADKVHGVTYTPKLLADFVARQIVAAAGSMSDRQGLRVFDPAVGEGELLTSLVGELKSIGKRVADVSGFETDVMAAGIATARLGERFPDVRINISRASFLDSVQDRLGDEQGVLQLEDDAGDYDLVIANPPYVRTQIMGTVQAQILARQFGLSGRVDLYHAFILGLSRALSPTGVMGLIVSNRFMTTRSGATVRKALEERLEVLHVWDLGDTKIFDAAVLPAVLVARGSSGTARTRFTTVYQTTKKAAIKVANPIVALCHDGVMAVPDGRRFEVRHGRLNTGGVSDGIWRISTDAIDRWLATVDENQWGTFGDIGRVRVGVKTCADSVFIRDDWDTVSTGPPELLRPLTTHHVGQRFRPRRTSVGRQILYPHESVDGERQAVDLDRYPKSRAYLERHRRMLEERQYVLDAGRAWYELWVPQDPSAWSKPKLVFRDIAEEPTFWVDYDGSVVNGDCYWLTSKTPPGDGNGVEGEDLLWLAAAVGNSTFATQFYDYRFNNKLYAGRRRYQTQYVEKFPLPDPSSSVGKAIVEMAKKMGTRAYDTPSATQGELDAMVWTAFGIRR